MKIFIEVLREPILALPILAALSFALLILREWLKRFVRADMVPEGAT